MLNQTITTGKDLDDLHKYGYMRICYADNELVKARALAEETCKQYGLEPLESHTERYQCKFTAPHRAVFRCYDPKMRYADGRIVNVFKKLETTVTK